MNVQAYGRSAERDGRLPMRTKLAQAIGAFPSQVADWAFASFLLLYYNQVLGLPASAASLAVTVSIIVDAVIDPAVGSYSDGLVNRWGRRHPLMYASIVPMALTLWALFSPPTGLSETGVFIWLLIFSCASRIAISVFAVPWTALFPELTDNYVERSEILAYRWAAGIVSVGAFQAIAWALIFQDSGDKVGQLVESNYALFAIALGVLVAGVAVISASLTHREIKFLRQPVAARSFSLKTVVIDLYEALKSRNFLLLFIGLLVSNTITGTVTGLRLFGYTYFWGLQPANLKYFALSALGAFVALAAIPALNRRFEKRYLLVCAIVINLLDNFVIVGLRFLGFLPDNGDPLLVTILVVNEAFHGFMVVIIATMFYSMVADTVDEQELRTHTRQEGVFSAAIGFSSKAISGFGVLAAGLILEFFVRLPAGVSPAAVPSDVVTRLGIVIGFGLPFLHFIPATIISFYNLSRAKHGEILDALAARRTGDTRMHGDIGGRAED